MSELPRHPLSRAVRLAALPLGLAGRTAAGLGRRLGGAPAEAVARELQARTAEQLFQVLGELKGGAMKVGQLMSTLEGALPDDMAVQVHDSLARLQEAAPPLPAKEIHTVLAAELGPRWRRRLTRFEDRAAQAASLGQVHRAVWGGRPVAVKVQYPGADEALMTDVNKIAAVLRVSGTLMPGLDMDALVSEMKARVAEELDYELEATRQRAFAEAFAGDDRIFVPAVRLATPRVLVTDWLDGTPLGRIIASGTQAERDDASEHYLEFLLRGPAEAGLIHADPHPGNFRRLPDGRLGVLDFGSVGELPHGMPPVIGRLIAEATAAKPDGRVISEGLAEVGFIMQGIEVDPVGLARYLAPFVEPARAERFRFDNQWLQGLVGHVNHPGDLAWIPGRKINLPPDYLMIYRVWIGALGVLCQLRGEVGLRGQFARWLPGFDPS